jgi:hypothetical protein
VATIEDVQNVYAEPYGPHRLKVYYLTTRGGEVALSWAELFPLVSVSAVIYSQHQ